MATVRLNEQSRSAIKQNLRRMFNPRKEAINKEWSQLDLQKIICAHAITPCPPNYELLIAQFPSFFHTVDYLEIKVIASNNSVLFTRNFSASGELYGPRLNGTPRWHNATRVDLLDSSPEGQLCLALYAKETALDKEEKALLEGPIAKAIEECLTLKQLIEVWPSALDFVTSEMRAKHAERALPAAKKEKLRLETLAIPDEVKIDLIKARMNAQ